MDRSDDVYFMSGYADYIFEEADEWDEGFRSDQVREYHIRLEEDDFQVEATSARAAVLKVLQDNQVQESDPDIEVEGVNYDDEI